MRESGYYWVKFHYNDDWTVAEFNYGKFVCDGRVVDPSIVDVINENRIKNPDEK